VAFVLSIRLKKQRFFLLINQMELTYVTIVVLASMVFVLSGMVGYLYWQQTRMLQHLQSLAVALATHVEQTRQQVVEDNVAQDQEEQEQEEEDDRVSVAKEQVEIVEGPPTTDVDVDDLQDKTSAQLRELLTKKGIPFGKRDSKTVLLELLKATA
jgi:hypothetical protein